MLQGRRQLQRTLLLFLVIYQSDCFANALTAIGDIGQFLLPTTALVSTYFLHDHEGLIEFSKAYLTSMTTVFLLKPIFNRRRPDYGYQSFPSGHTASAFAGAGFIQQRYGWQYGVPAYLLGGVVGYSRVASKHHWTSDVIAGGLIGIGANLLFTRRYPQLCVGPAFDDQQVGISAQVSW